MRIEGVGYELGREIVVIVGSGGLVLMHEDSALVELPYFETELDFMIRAAMDFSFQLLQDWLTTPTSMDLTMDYNTIPNCSNVSLYHHRRIGQ